MAKKSLTQKPIMQSPAQALVVRGLELQKNNQLFEAAQLYFEALKIEPKNYDALHLLGAVAAQNKDFEQAFIYFGRAIEVNPLIAAAYSNMGTALHDSGRHDEAIGYFEKSLEIQPDFIEALYNLAGAHQALGNLEQALVFYGRVLKINPRRIEALNNRGNVFQRLRRFNEAMNEYDRAIEIDSSFPGPFSNRGNLNYLMGKFEDALIDLNQAIALKTDYAHAYNNRGNVFKSLNKPQEALADFQKAIELDENYAEPYHNQGNLWLDFMKYNDALICFENALRIEPTFEYLTGARIYTKLHLCNWENLEQQTAQFITKAVLGEKVAPPFHAIPLVDSGLIQKQIAQTWIADKHPATQELPPLERSTTPKDRKIRLGYYSADFHNHATMYLMAKLFEMHDRSAFELFAFSFGPVADDAMRRRAVAAFDHFIDVRERSDLEIAKLSRELGIDIAVDLKGFTQHGRTTIFAHRAAPIQVNYLGYPGTMGAPYIDYIIADPILAPPGSELFYTEKVAYMPHSYQVNDDERVIADTVYTRAQMDLPEAGFVFCCFNNNYKILPPTLEGWVRILNAVPGSVLWLLEDNPTAGQNLRQAFVAAGLDPNRLIFAKRLPLAEHLARHRLADLFLDTLPCNAHTTTSDALWAGLPVLTLMGEAFAGRVSASLLNAIGLPELITSSQAQYEQKAIELAQNPEKLGQIKATLIANRATHPLFNTAQYTKDLEALYRGMVGR